MEFVVMVFVLLIFLCLYCFQKMSNDLTRERIMNERLEDIGLELLFSYDDANNCVQLYHNQENTQFKILMIKTEGTYTDYNLVYKLDATDIRKVELYEDNSCSMSVGRAVVGGVLFGGAGAIVGAGSGKSKIDNLSMVIYTRNIQQPQILVPILSKTTRKDEPSYIRGMDFARKVIGALEIVIEQNQGA